MSNNKIYKIEIGTDIYDIAIDGFNVDNISGNINGGYNYDSINASCSELNGYKIVTGLKPEFNETSTSLTFIIEGELTIEDFPETLDTKINLKMVSIQYSNNFDTCGIINSLNYDEISNQTTVVIDLDMTAHRLALLKICIDKYYANDGIAKYVWFPYAPQLGNISLAKGAVSLGANTHATHVASFAAGYNTYALGKYSFTAGKNNQAGFACISTGQDCIALGETSAAHGSNCIVYGDNSYVGGKASNVDGNGTFAYGYGLNGPYDNQIILGRYNDPDPTAFMMIGNGDNDSSRKNALILDNQGNGIFSGDVQSSSASLNSVATDVDSLRSTVDSLNTKVENIPVEEISDLYDIIKILNLDQIDGTPGLAFSSDKTTLIGRGESSAYNVKVPGHVGTTAVTRISNNAFNGDSRLTTLVFNNPDERAVIIEDSSDPSIGAFKSCSSLREINLYGVQTVGVYAFRNNNKLTTIDLKGVKEIKNRAFFQCKDNLTTLKNLDSVTTLGSAAFGECPKLSGHIDLPSTLLSIESQVFTGTGISKITFNTRPQQISAQAFKGMNNLTEIHVCWSSSETMLPGEDTGWGSNANVFYVN